MDGTPKIVRYREYIREEVSIRGKVIYVTDIHQAIGCLIVNMSQGGAQVDLDEECILPHEVLLFESRNENIYECTVRWRNASSVGLNFTDLCTKAVRHALLDDETLDLIPDRVR